MSLLICSFSVGHLSGILYEQIWADPAGMHSDGDKGQDRSKEGREYSQLHPDKLQKYESRRSALGVAKPSEMHSWSSGRSR